MEIQNIKFHLRVKEQHHISYCVRIKKSEFNKKTLFSFCVLRVGGFVYNCFFSGYINITGVRNHGAIACALRALYFALKVEEKENIFDEPTIDNITASHKIVCRKKICLSEKKQRLRDRNEIITIKYNRERFPNMFIKTKLGTIIWSPNNVVCSVGTKTLSNLTKLSLLVFHYNQI